MHKINVIITHKQLMGKKRLFMKMIPHYKLHVVRRNNWRVKQFSSVYMKLKLYGVSKFEVHAVNTQSLPLNESI